MSTIEIGADREKQKEKRRRDLTPFCYETLPVQFSVRVQRSNFRIHHVNILRFEVFYKNKNEKRRRKNLNHGSVAATKLRTAYCLFTVGLI